jgi:uncharacterized membrane protein YqhA
MQRLLSGSRYLIIVPIVGLAIAAAYFFIFGGIGLFKLLIELVGSNLGNIGGEIETDSTLIILEVVEFVHIFLVGTVLYITAIGFYQLFIHEIKFPGWLKIDSTEELETNLIGVTVVVLAVNFMSMVFVGGAESLLDFGAGIALPIAALGLFIGLRAWSTKLDKEIASTEEGWDLLSATEPTSQKSEGNQIDHEPMDVS